MLVLVTGFCAFAGKGARLVGALHGFAHLAANLILTWLLVLSNFLLLNRGVPRTNLASMAENTVDSGFQTVLFAIEMLLFGSVVAGIVFGVYLTLCALVPPRYLHINEAFSAQAIPDFKNFLRMRFDATGALTIFPIGVRKICRWTLRDKAAENPADHEPWFKPEGDIKLDSLIELIEGPLRFTAPGPPGPAPRKPNGPQTNGGGNGPV
jgi:hypothetical protein